MTLVTDNLPPCEASLQRSHVSSHQGGDSFIAGGRPGLAESHKLCLVGFDSQATQPISGGMVRRESLRRSTLGCFSLSPMKHSPINTLGHYPQNKPGLAATADGCFSKEGLFMTGQRGPELTRGFLVRLEASWTQHPNACTSSLLKTGCAVTTENRQVPAPFTLASGLYPPARIYAFPALPIPSARLLNLVCGEIRDGALCAHSHQVETFSDGCLRHHTRHVLPFQFDASAFLCNRIHEHRLEGGLP